MITSLEKYLTTLSTSCSFVGEKGNGTIREVILTTSCRSKLALSLSVAIISINEIQYPIIPTTNRETRLSTGSWRSGGP